MPYKSIKSIKILGLTYWSIIIFTSTCSFILIFLSFATFFLISNSFKNRLNCLGLPFKPLFSKDDILFDKLYASKIFSLLEGSILSGNWNFVVFNLNCSIHLVLKFANDWLSINLEQNNNVRYISVSDTVIVGILIGYCIIFSKYSLPIFILCSTSNILSEYFWRIAYEICLSSAPKTNATFPSNKNSLIASNISNIVSGKHLSISSIYITTRESPLSWIKEPNCSLKFDISSLSDLCEVSAS